MPEVRVGTVEDEHVGEPRHRQAQVGHRTIGPGLVQVDSARTGDLQRCEEFGGCEAGAEDQRVQLVEYPVGGNDSVGCDPLHPGIGHGHVLAQQRRVPVVGYEQTPAARWVVGNQDLPWEAVVGEFRQLLVHALLEQPPQRRVASHQVELRLEAPVGPPAICPPQRRQV